MKLIPAGIENFKEMIDKNAYYVDKTNLIIDVLNEQVVFCKDREDLVRHLICRCCLFLFY